jgi:putative transcriptional regulator
MNCLKMDILFLSNLSILKTRKAKAKKFNTLESLCKVLDCQPDEF